MKKELRWRAYYGFEPHEYVSFGVNDLAMVKYVFLTGKPTVIDRKALRGDRIIRIEEDYRYYTGWYDSYAPKNGDDEQQILRDMPPISDFQKFETLADGVVRNVISGGSVKALNEPLMAALDNRDTEVPSLVQNLSDKLKLK